MWCFGILNDAISSHHPQELFCLEGRNPFYLGKKAELGKFRIPEVFLPLIIIIKTNRLGDFSPSNLIIPYIDSNRQSSFIVMLCPYLAPFQLSSLRALHHLGSGDWGIPNLKYDLQVWICQGKGRSPKKKSRKSDPEDKFVINSGKLWKPNFFENFCPYCFSFDILSEWPCGFSSNFPFFTRTYCNYIWSGPACQSLRGKEAEARNATRQPAPCLMSFTGSTKKSFLLRMPYLFLFFTGWCKTVLAVTCESGYCKFG